MTTTITAALALGLALSQATAPPDSAPPAATGQAAPAPFTQPFAPAAPGAPALPALALGDALARAAAANPDLKVTQARLRQANEAIWKAWSYQLPQVALSGSVTRNSDEAIFAMPTGYWIRDMGTQQGPDAGQGVDGAPTTYALQPSGVLEAVIQQRDQVGGQAEVRQALIAPSLWFAIQAAYRGANVADWSVETARREIFFGVAQAFYGVASLRRLHEVSERLLEIAVRQERDAEVRYRAGAIAKVGYLRAEIDRARAEQDVRRARNNYLSAKIALAALLDRDDAFEVAEPPQPQLPAEGAGLEDRALRQRPEVMVARESVGLAEAVKRSTVAKYLPNLGAFGRYLKSNVGGFTGKTDAWAVGLALTWNVFDGGLREAELREASARVAEAEASRRSAEVRAVAEVRQAALDLESARANAEKAREQRDLAAENQRLVDVSFRAGAATAVEQADATAALRNAEIAYATEDLTAQLSALRLLKVAGAFDPVPRAR
jgi:outer membrane protein TolC